MNLRVHCLLVSFVLCVSLPASGGAPVVLALGDAKVMNCGPRSSSLGKLLTAELYKQAAGHEGFILKGKTSKKGPKASYLLVPNVICASKMSLVLSLCDVETAKIAWTRIELVSGAGELKPGVAEMFRHLLVFLETGKAKALAEIKGSRLQDVLLQIGPLADSGKKLPAGTASIWTAQLKGRLQRLAGAQVELDRSCKGFDQLKMRAEDDGVELVLWVELKGKASACELTWHLHDVAHNKALAKFSSPCGCDGKSINATLDQAVRRLATPGK